MTTKKTKKTKKTPAEKTSTKRSPRRKKVAGEGQVHFVTGYPGFIGKRLVHALATEQPGARIYVLVQEKFEADATAYVRSLPGGQHIQVLVGDVVDMDLGLSGPEYKRLLSEVTDIWHLAAIYYLGVRKEHARRVNVDGTRRMLDLGREVHDLRRFNHMSTAWVCGDRVGVIAEDELEMGQRFRNAYEETKYHAEILVRDAMADLPITIYRPSIVVGDSKTGEIDRFDGPYYIGILLVTSPIGVPLPLPGDGVAPLNTVPVDFVVSAMLQAGGDSRAVNRTLHLVDPNPMSSRRVYQLIAERSGRSLPRMNLSFRLTDRIMRLPGLERMIRQQRQAIEYVNHLAIFNSHNTLEILDGTGVRCPPLASYLDTLLEFVKKYYREKSDRQDGDGDPLDSAPSPLASRK